MSWFERVQLTVHQIAVSEGLDGTPRRGFPCPACHASKRDGRRLPVGVTRGGTGWRCHKCGVGGGWLDYLAWVRYGSGYNDITTDQAREIRASCEGRDWSALPAPAGPVTGAGAVYPPDVAGFWQRCRALTDCGDDTKKWMLGRGFGRELALLEAQDLARMTPRDKGAYPDWWPAGRRTHWRLIVQAWDVDGELRSVHARCIGEPPVIHGEAAPKPLWPKHPDPDQRFDAHGLFFADARALKLLRGEPVDVAALVLLEGLTDWLAAAGWAEGRVAAGTSAPVACLGGASGAWDALVELRERLPEGLPVIAATDGDKSGDGYARAITQALGPVFRLRLGTHEGGARRDVDDFIRDGGDLGVAINGALQGERQAGQRAALLAWWAEHPEATSAEAGAEFGVPGNRARAWRSRARNGDEGGATASERVAPSARNGDEGGATASASAPSQLAEIITRLEQVETSARGELLVKLLEDASFAVILGETWRVSEARVMAGCERLRAVGYPARQVSQLQKIASSQAKRLEAAERWRHAEVIQGGGSGGATDSDEDVVRVEDALRPLLEGGPLPGGLIVPTGWALRPDGLFRLVRSEEGQLFWRAVADAPILVTGRLQDVRTGKAQVQVSWHHRDRMGGRWLGRIVQRSLVADGRSIVALSDHHAPVNSTNARDVVKFLAAFEAANQVALPCATSTATLGWQADGSFLLGERLIAAGTVTALEPTAPAAAWVEGQVQLQEDEYLQQLVGGYTVSGTWEGWLDAHRRVADRPAVQLALYASLVAPILRLLPEIPNFSLDWSGTTSLGKTSSLRFAASVWGVPNEDAEDGKTVLHTWKKTAVWIENASWRRSGLPLLLDDTKKARDPDQVQRILFDVEGGQGAGRGQRDGGARALATFRTILLSTGEYPITTIGKGAHGGAVARVIELSGSPLGGECKGNGDLAKLLKLDLMAHHGHAGERLVRWLTAEPRTVFLRELYREYLLTWGGLAGDNAVAGRAADYLAALSLGRDLAVRVLGLPGCDEALNLAWDAVCRNTQRADVAWSAMQALLSWAGSRRHLFQGSSTQLRIAPTSGWLGVWDDGIGWDEIGFETGEVRRFLREWGCEAPLALVKAWADKGWLRHDKGHTTAQILHAGQRPRLICVQRSAWLATQGD